MNNTTTTESPRTETPKNLDLALTAAREYGRLSRLGRWAEAQQQGFQIDTLVGYRDRDGVFCWPDAVNAAVNQEASKK